jgi:hypothetical protein
VVHTPAEPPNQGRICFAITGCTRNRRKALRNTVSGYRTMNGGSVVKCTLLFGLSRIVQGASRYAAAAESLHALVTLFFPIRYRGFDPASDRESLQRI